MFKSVKRCWTIGEQRYRMMIKILAFYDDDDDDD